LIAVTVAVSIAVAAWMGALTFTFMRTEELKISSHTWVVWTTSEKTIKLTAKNTGTSKMSLGELRINDNSLSAPKATAGALSAGQWNSTASGAIKNTLDPGDEVSIYVRYDFSAGTKYDFTVFAATGTKFLYTAVGPS